MQLSLPLKGPGEVEREAAISIQEISEKLRRLEGTEPGAPLAAVRA